MREYASPNLYDFSLGIMCLAFEGNGWFEIKPIMLQMLHVTRQFGGVVGEDPHAHLKSFMDIYNTFSIPGVTPDVIRLSLLFHSKMRRDYGFIHLNQVRL